MTSLHKLKTYHKKTRNGKIWGTLPKKTRQTEDMGYATKNMGQTEDMGKFVFVLKNVKKLFFRYGKCRRRNR